MVDDDKKHWEALFETVIERIGVEAAIDHFVYALEEQGHDQLAHEIRKVSQRLVAFVEPTP
jgi:hypothetical protein